MRRVGKVGRRSSETWLCSQAVLVAEVDEKRRARSSPFVEGGWSSQPGQPGGRTRRSKPARGGKARSTVADPPGSQAPCRRGPQLATAWAGNGKGSGGESLRPEAVGGRQKPKGRRPGVGEALVWRRGYSSAEGVLVLATAWSLTRPRWRWGLAGVCAGLVERSGRAGRSRQRASEVELHARRGGEHRRREARRGGAFDRGATRSARCSSSRRPGPWPRGMLAVAVKPKLEVRRQARLHPAIRRHGNAEQKPSGPMQVDRGEQRSNGGQAVARQRGPREAEAVNGNRAACRVLVS